MTEFLTQGDFLPLAFGAGMVVAALTLLLVLATMFAGDQKRMRRRLARVRGERDASLAIGANAPSLRRNTTDSSIKSIDKLIKRLLPRSRLRERLAATGRRISVGEFALACILAGAATFVALSFFGQTPLVAGLFAVVATLGVPHFVVGFMIKRRTNLFVMLLPEAIDLIVRGLRSGLPITEAIKVVGQEVPDPVGIEFRRIIESFSVGLTLEQALWAVAERINVPEFRFFAISLSVQQETGGNLTETLENLGEVLRRRKQVKLKIRALTGEARASATILGALPFIMFGVLLLVNPGYGMVLIDTHQGHVFLGVGFSAMMLGVGIMFRMTKFEI